MSALPTREFRVFLHTWDVYDVTVDAASGEDALAKAEALYNAEGTGAFALFNSGQDGFQLEEDI
ncbi:hypothetical protein [Rhizobium leguminosarum]|uniref:hypothetical protein n=1 Tax=Rhizobium leguminosarum TaxID=384 RepID=UPI001037804A|nr:hypothetical protein [Rhizobium leguminosarum]TBF85700.1 hypothetical protein ELG85_37205 [Rhizobium leguminosarum]